MQSVIEYDCKFIRTLQNISLYQCFLGTKTRDIPQNLSNHIVLNAELQQNSDTYFLLKSLKDIIVKKVLFFDNRDV